MTLGETLPVKHSAHILISVSWAGSEGGLAAAGPQRVPGGGCSTQLGPGSASPEIGQLEGRKTRAEEGCTQGLKWGREEVSWFCTFLLGAAPSKARRWFKERSQKTHREAGRRQQWHTGAAQGVPVGRSWAAEAASSQPGLCKASCASTASKT